MQSTAAVVVVVVRVQRVVAANENRDAKLEKTSSN